MKIAITGSSGFIGTHLSNELTIRGHTISADADAERVYHLACPSTTAAINDHTIAVMDAILDNTRQTMTTWPDAKFINASSMGAEYLDDSAQGAYNIAKYCMEIYLKHSRIDYVNYRLPAVYGPGMKDDHFIKRCVDRVAYMPKVPEKLYYIAHVSEVVDAMIDLRPIQLEEITLGRIYELFNSGRRGLHRPASNQGIV